MTNGQRLGVDVKVEQTTEHRLLESDPQTSPG